VWRKRFYLDGPAESGRVTSLVRYARGSAFHSHEHPQGEEILVLEGVFSDEAGDWPAGTYVLNPEGFRHGPSSHDGCVLFVKLRQYGGEGREQIRVDTDSLAWQKLRGGVERKILYSDVRFPERTWLERWAPGTAAEQLTREVGCELFVLEGELIDEQGTYGPLTWLRLPPGAEQRPRSEEGCLLYVRTGGLE
jgi:anti-sigma factor ChrR (cupin superfamily)